MRNTQEVIERTQQLLATSRAFRERADAGRKQLRAQIEQAMIKKGQLAFVFPVKPPEVRSH